MKKLTEDTLIPISLVVILLGGVMWLSDLYNASRANAANIQRVENKQDEYNRDVNAINQRLSRIEGKLGTSSE